MRDARQAGMIPATLYGHGNDPVSLTINSDELETLVKKSDAGVNTLMGGQGADTFYVDEDDIVLDLRVEDILIFL